MLKNTKLRSKKSSVASEKSGLKKKFTLFTPRIRSRHPSHSILRGALPKFPKRCVIRLGSTTEVDDVEIQVNTVEAISNSASKLRMKRCFDEANVKTAKWTNDVNVVESYLQFPIVSKHIFGSRGRGNTLLKTLEEFNAWKKNKSNSELSNYIFEQFYNYNREYRLHVTEDGCFYTCRKMLKSDVPEKDRWYRNDSNSVWILETNEQFDKPVNWDLIVSECVKALKSTGLDFGACDVRVQSAKKDNKVRKEVDFIIVEINSAPSFGELTSEKYLEELPKIIKKKIK